jgi:predicted RNA-binding protein with PUA-like domain
MNYWLFKSEPSTFSIDDLEKLPSQTSFWDGIRNYQVRNFLRDAIHPGALAFFYHSSCPNPGIVGIMEVVSEGYPDPSAWDASSPGYDPQSKPEAPRWYGVEVRLQKKFKRLISLEEIKKNPALSKMLIARQGNRLSITPLTSQEWKTLLELAQT